MRARGGHRPSGAATARCRGSHVAAADLLVVGGARTVDQTPGEAAATVVIVGKPVPRRLSNRDRRNRTRELATARRSWQPPWAAQQHQPAPAPWDPLLWMCPPPAGMWRRRRRCQAFAARRGCQCGARSAGRSRHTAATWGLWGQRVGKARHPGPPSAWPPPTPGAAQARAVRPRRPLGCQQHWQHMCTRCLPAVRSVCPRQQRCLVLPGLPAAKDGPWQQQCSFSNTWGHAKG